MPYIQDGRPLIQHAFEHHYAMPSFNVCSLEMARACIDAAEAERAPIMLQTYPGDLEQASPRVMASMIRALAEEASVPILLHLDHGDSFERAVTCLRAGYGSVMYDGAEYALDENVSRTKRVVEVAHAAGAAVEAAAGSFGGGEGHDEDAVLTDPELAKRLKDGSGADMIACSVGSRHGQPSHLDIDRLASIAEVLRAPIVLHGGTGIPAADLAQAVQLGVVKVNIGAGLQRALLQSWRDLAPEATIHYPVFVAAREKLTAVAQEKIRIMKASGQAPV